MSRTASSTTTHSASNKEQSSLFTQEFIDNLRDELQKVTNSLEVNFSVPKFQICKFFEKLIQGFDEQQKYDSILLAKSNAPNKDYMVNIFREIMRWIFMISDQPSSFKQAQTSNSEQHQGKDALRLDACTLPSTISEELLDEYRKLILNDVETFRQIIRWIISLLFINESKHVHKYVQWGLQQAQNHIKQGLNVDLNTEIIRVTQVAFTEEMTKLCSVLFELRLSATSNAYVIEEETLTYQCRQLEHIIELDAVHFGETLEQFLFIILYKLAKVIEHTVSQNAMTGELLFDIVFGSTKLSLAYINRFVSAIEQAFKYFQQNKGRDVTQSNIMELLSLDNEHLESKYGVMWEALMTLSCVSFKFVFENSFPRDCKRVGALLILRLVDLSFENKDALMQMLFEVFIRDFINTDTGALSFSFLSDKSQQYTYTKQDIENISRKTILGIDSQSFKDILIKSNHVTKMAWFSSVISAMTVAKLDVDVTCNGHSYNLLFDGFFSLLNYYCLESKDSDLKLFSILSYGNSLVFVQQYAKTQKMSAMDADTRLLFETRLCNLLKQAIQIVFRNIENPIYDIFAKMRQLFMDVLDLRDDLTLGEIKSQIDLTVMAKNLLETEWTRKGKYISLIALLSRVGAAKMHQLCPTVFSNTLSVFGHLNGSVNGNASLFYERMVSDMFKDCKKDQNLISKWEENCLSPVINFLALCTKKQRSAVFIHLFPKLLKVNPHCLGFLVNGFKTQLHFANTSAEYSALLHSIIFTLKTAKSLTIYELDFERDLSFIEKAFIHNDHDIRLDAFDLVITSTKKTAMPSKIELELVIKFIRLNLRGCKSSFRYGFGDAIERFVKRVNEIAMRIFLLHQRNQSLDLLMEISLPTTLKLPEKKLDELHKDRDSYALLMNFLYEYAFEVFNSLYPGCPHERLLVALDCCKSLLKTFANNFTIDVFYPTNSEKQVTWKRMSLFSSKIVLSLLNTLGSCWDKVRVVIYELLLLFPAPLSGFEDPETVKILATNAFELIKSPRLRESDAGALLYRLLFNKYSRDLNWELQLEDQPIISKNGQTDNTVSTQLTFCRKLTKLLKEKTESCSQSIFNIAKGSALIGILQTLIYIISDLDFSKEKHFATEWRQWMEDLVGTLELACSMSVKIIAGISTGDSENGEDGVGVDCRGHIYFDNDEEATEDSHSLTVNCWLAVKGAAMLIATIVQHVELYPDPQCRDELSPECMLTFSQVEKLGDILLNVLLMTKHNGAIEKSAVGFNMLCKRLITCGVEKLANIPTKWTRYLLDGIGKEDLFSILRRSAGLPWTFAAIMKAEPTALPKKLLPETMEYLLNIALNKDNYSTNQIVNALNVLRFLFHDASLGTYVQQFVEDGFIVSLKGFSSTVWAIKNSSLMVYTALLHRSFGDNDSNKTGIEFFTRYSRLRSFLLEQLDLVTNENREQKRVLHPSLYPMLLLLSRLRPSLEENTDAENNSVSAFIPYVKKCFTMIHHMARSIGARALEPLIPSVLVKECVLESISRLPSQVSQIESQNQLHGLLCQINRFVTTSFKGLENVQEFSVECLSQLSTSCVGTLENRCFGTRSVFFEIFYHLIRFTYANIPQHIVESLWNCAVNTLFSENDSTTGQPWKQEMFGNAATLTCMLYFYCKEDTDSNFILNLVRHSVMDVRRAIMKFLSKKEHFTHIKNYLTVQQIRPIILEHALFTETDAECARFGLAALVTLYTQSEANIYQDVSNMEHEFPGITNRVPERLFYLYKKDANTFIHQHVVELLGLFIPTLLDTDPNGKFVKMWLKIIEHASDPVRQSHVRAACIESIVHSRILYSLSDELCKTRFIAWTCLITLLQDEDDEIRERASLVLSPLIASFDGSEAADHAHCSELQREFVIERTFALVAEKFSHLDECKNFLFSCISLPEAFNEKPQNYEIILPFKNNDEETMLFEKEEDNVFTEELAISQLASFHLSALKTLNETMKQEMVSKLEKQVTTILQVLSKQRKQQLGLFWIGNYSYQPTIFITLAKLILSMNALGHSMVDLQQLSSFMENQEIKDLNYLLDPQFNFFLLSQK
ncbi:hypothetical protein C9374_010183 [Naegleria lovaniensis]|uniref:DUF2428 domain-containing protein n=1 Tax=Naegleria lovaniensis TaxID=51637 RepID=A0AA88GIG5_NAELO|nr:uncharacterized protein C9374_010183 [Naegleria lovaniensis]KAG2375179.1 hypothetical protein C9374_010183 [Naegleria lovaniensis]